MLKSVLSVVACVRGCRAVRTSQMVLDGRHRVVSPVIKNSYVWSNTAAQIGRSFLSFHDHTQTTQPVELA